jgi:hypothetical protein
MTEEIMKISMKYSQGRVISVLEGGYNINSGVVSSFAQSVYTHVKFLNIGSQKNEEVEKKSKMKRKRDYLSDLENYRRSKKQKLLENEIQNTYDSTNENENKFKNCPGYEFRKRKKENRDFTENEILDKKQDYNINGNRSGYDKNCELNEEEKLNRKNLNNEIFNDNYEQKVKTIDHSLFNNIIDNEKNPYIENYFKDDNHKRKESLEIKEQVILKNNSNEIDTDKIIKSNDHNDKCINDIMNNDEEFEVEMIEDETNLMNK